MSLLNLGLQSVGLMRKQMDDAYESIVSGCNSISEVRKAAEKYPNIKGGTADSISAVKCQYFSKAGIEGEESGVLSIRNFGGD